MADKTTPMDGIQEIDELVLEDNQLVCVLTNKVVKATDDPSVNDRYDG